MSDLDRAAARVALDRGAIDARTANALTPPIALVAVDDLVAVVREAVRSELNADRARPAAPACDWIGAAECAQRIGVEKDYLRKLRKKGLPHHGSVRAPRYLRAEVDAWIRARPR